MPKVRLIGLLTALIILLADQASKIYALSGLDLEFSGTLTLTPFVDLVLVWNHGISYGLFQQNADFGRYLLVALSFGASIGFAFWLWRTNRVLPALSIGLIAGGAIGNGIDRLFRGAVVDFNLLHLGAWQWYVFNIADAAIVAGVALLLYDSWLGNDQLVKTTAEKEPSL
jgi:signal peptidase II